MQFDDTVLGWPESAFSFFHKIKNTVFMFANNFIDLDILNMSLFPTTDF